ncbi:MAG: hypothetical protein HZB56_19915 [Deltaproteobacteria bacterium]|nr:hypothetical protein [Deltaproteobacteria bacterium]
MARAPVAKPDERSAGGELPVWTLKLKQALQRSAPTGFEPSPAPPEPAAVESAAAVVEAPPPPTPASALPPANAEPPARPAARHAEVAHHGLHLRPEARARRTLTPAPRRSHTPPPLAFATGAAPGSTVIRLQLPDGRQLLALLPQVPRAGEIVDLAEIGAATAQPYDVVSVRWGVHAAGGFTGVNVELRPRA